MLLIFPPFAKASEPPAGIARLAGALGAAGVRHRLWDANLAGQLWLIGQPESLQDSWGRRAVKHRADHLNAMRDSVTYRSPARYRRVVNDLNHLLYVGAERHGTASLCDYQDHSFSPISSKALLSAANTPESNLFYPFFNQNLPLLMGGVGTVAFSLNYLSQAVCCFAMIGYVRSRFPGVKIVLGGGLVTSWMRRSSWQNPFAGLVDQMVAGPGEESLLRIAGTVSAVEGRFDYGGLPLKDYLAPGLVLPYSSASGCWWNRCSFCPEQAEGNPYRPVPASMAHRELKRLVQIHRPSMLHLLDNAISPAMLDLLAADPPGTNWYGFVRFDSRLTDLEYCRMLRRSGCVMLKLGLESGDQSVLNRLDKGIDLGVASVVLKNLHKAGIGVYCYLLFGTPVEGEQEAEKTLSFVVDHSECISFLNLAIFNMPIQCGYSAQHATELFYEGDLSLYTAFKHPGGWDRRLVRRFVEKRFKKHPAISDILQNDPPFFTSNHAPFFVS